MKGGTKVHKRLEEEVYTTVKVDISKREDAFGLKVWNIIQGLRTLRDTGMTRELEIWGMVNGQVVNGVIDGLTYENPDPEFEKEARSSNEGKKQQKITSYFGGGGGEEEEHDRQVYLLDVKTRATATLPSGAAVRPSKMQLFLYRRFLANMAAGKLDLLRVFRRYGLDLDEVFSDSFLAQIAQLHEEVMVTDQDSSSDTSSQSLRYVSLRELLPLLRYEIRLTFPHGAESIGRLVMIEYRQRAPPPPKDGDPVSDPDPDKSDDGGGRVIGANVFYVDDELLDEYLASDMEWWQGVRPPSGVAIEEAYKCRSCEFAPICEWRQGQEVELAQRARDKSAAASKKD
jgi:exonuclease V